MIALLPEKGQTHDTVVGLGLLLQSEDGALRTSYHVSHTQFGRRVNFTDGRMRTIHRQWDREAQKYHYWAE